VEDDSPAEGAGLEPGDLIVALGGEPVDGVESLYTALDSVAAAGGELELTVVRGTDERSVTVRFGAREAA
jgi:S1-C subfamily serine protease